MRFEALSRLNINLDKSELFTVGMVVNAEGLADDLGCKLGSFCTTYLGMPLGAVMALRLCRMEWKNSLKETSYVEKTIYLQGRKGYTNQKYLV